jgi:hypothetical protein
VLNIPTKAISYFTSSSPLVGGTFGFFTNQFIFPYAAYFKFPRIKRFIVEHIPWSRVQEIKKLVDIMHETSLEIIKAKKDALNSSDPVVAKEMMMKKDIISILSEFLFFLAAVQVFHVC